MSIKITSFNNYNTINDPFYQFLKENYSDLQEYEQIIKILETGLSHEKINYLLLIELTQRIKELQEEIKYMMRV